MCFKRKTVKVNVCYLSNMLPNEYCPSTVVRQYYKGQEPTALCTIHKAEPIPPDPPPTIRKCDIPANEVGTLLMWSGFMIGGLSMRDTAMWKEDDLPAYLDALVEDGVNSHRDLFFFKDSETGEAWQSYIPWVGDDYSIPNEEYYSVIDKRLGLFYERKLTEIVSLTPYGLSQNLVFDPKFQSCIREFVRRTKKYLPFVRYETFNEPGGTEDDKFYVNQIMVDILKQENIPNWAIQIAFVDRSANSNILVNTLGGDATMSLHWVGSMETIQEDEKPWEGSPGTQWLMGHGLGSSDDGQDKQRKSLGLNWGYLEAQGITEARRPNDDQLYEMTGWMLRKFELMELDETTGQYVYTGKMVNGRLIEHLSAAAFQHPYEQPNMKQAIEIGRSERLAMRRAFNEVRNA